MSSPGPQVLPPLCSKLGGSWPAVPAGLICGLGHGDIHSCPPLTESHGSPGALLSCSPLLVWLWLTRVSHHHREERDLGFRVEKGLKVNGTLSLLTC